MPRIVVNAQYEFEIEVQEGRIHRLRQDVVVPIRVEGPLSRSFKTTFRKLTEESREDLYRKVYEKALEWASARNIALQQPARPRYYDGKFYFTIANHD